MTKANKLSIYESLSILARVLRFQKYAGVPDDAWERLSNSKEARHNHAEFMKQGCPKLSPSGVLTFESRSQSSGLDLVRAILHENYVSPAQLEQALGFKYTKAQLNHFVDTFPDLDTILWLYKHNYVLIPSFKLPLNLAGIKELFPKSLRDGKIQRVVREEDLYQNDFVFLGEWLMVGKDMVSGSVKKNWNRQEKLVMSPEFIPNVAELCYALLVIHKVNGSDLPVDFNARTTSIDRNNNHVSVASYGPKTIDIYNDNDTDEHETLGVSSARIK